MSQIQFLYDFSHLGLFHPGIITLGVGYVIGIFFSVFCLVGGHFFMGWIMLRRDESTIMKRKSMLQELIQMKDVQTEIEREIEKAMIQETFVN